MPVKGEYGVNHELVVDKAIKRCNGEGNWSRFDSIYPFTTENISGYINDFKLNNHSLLTTGSSGDQVLNAILLGAKDITILDINPFTLYYYYLKMAAILELNYYEFLDFFRYKNYPKVFKDNDLVFNMSSFNKLKDTLRVIDYEAFLFWDELFHSYSPACIRSHLFSNDEYKEDIVNKCNPYLCNSNTYEILRRKIKKVDPTFICDNIETYSSDRKYDNIWLSNILTQWYKIDSIKKLVLLFSSYLCDNGQMLISYLYDTTGDSKYDSKWADIYNLELFFNVLHDYNLELLTFTGVEGLLFRDNKFMPDSALVYRKRQRGK